MAKRYFSSQTMSFLRQLASHNQRDWFERHKPGYEEAVRGPALEFIADMADELALLSPHFLALPKKVGGSLLRVYRDVRFSRDKRPYKTHVGIQFRHECGRDIHAPGFYVHVEPGGCFVGMGIWRPDALALAKVRDAIAEQSGKWRSVVGNKTFTRQLGLSGESLLRAPRGYPKDHPLVDDLKRKDFIAIARLEDEQVLSPRVRQLVMRRFKAADAFMQFLCSTLDLLY